MQLVRDPSGAVFRVCNDPPQATAQHVSDEPLGAGRAHKGGSRATRIFWNPIKFSLFSFECNTSGVTSAYFVYGFVSVYGNYRGDNSGRYKERVLQGGTASARDQLGGPCSSNVFITEARGRGGGREPPGTHSECRTGATRSPSESRPRADPGPAGGRVSPDPGLSTPGTSTPGTS